MGTPKISGKKKRKRGRPPKKTHDKIKVSLPIYQVEGLRKLKESGKIKSVSGYIAQMIDFFALLGSKGAERETNSFLRKSTYAKEWGMEMKRLANKWKGRKPKAFVKWLSEQAEKNLKKKRMYEP